MFLSIWKRSSHSLLRRGAGVRLLKRLTGGLLRLVLGLGRVGCVGGGLGSCDVLGWVGGGGGDGGGVGGGSVGGGGLGESGGELGDESEELGEFGGLCLMRGLIRSGRSVFFSGLGV